MVRSVVPSLDHPSPLSAGTPIGHARVVRVRDGPEPACVRVCVCVCLHMCVCVCVDRPLGHLQNRWPTPRKLSRRPRHGLWPPMPDDILLPVESMAEGVAVAVVCTKGTSTCRQRYTLQGLDMCSLGGFLQQLPFSFWQHVAFQGRYLLSIKCIFNAY